MAQNAFLGLLPLLSNLVSPTSYTPAVTDIARQILAYLKATFDDYKAVGAEHSLFEVAVFGYCLREKRLEIHHFKTQKNNEMYQVVLESHLPLDAREFLYLGDDSTVMHEKIAWALSSPPLPGRPPARAPRFVIQDRIDDSQSPSIGGDLQLAIADQFGFRPLALVKPYVKGQPKSYVSYLGRELTDDLTYVGEARASPLMIV
jgi:hypothetical protein